MNSFISYSHKDSQMLEILHKHLIQLKRDGIITTWTDQEILAGGKLNQSISSALDNSKLFISLLSPDYLASNYCYEEEFKKALEMEKLGKIIIVPIVLEPCDWLSTPFQEFKTLPTDGKAVSTWENKNTAFLDVVQNLRKLLSSPQGNVIQAKPDPQATPSTRNYRVQKDFDSIEKMEFLEKGFHEVKELMKRYIEEIVQMENIKVRVLLDDSKTLEAILVNRNKIATEAKLKMSIISERSQLHSQNLNDMHITYSINSLSPKRFSLMLDEFHLFWSENNSYYLGSQKPIKEVRSKDIADVIWSEWLESVGIL